MNIVLNDVEQILSRSIAEARQRSARDAGQKNMAVSRVSPEQLDLEGAGAEVAFCKMMNVYPDTEPGKKSADCVLRDGRTVDVKSTAHPAGRLIAARWKVLGEVEVYALMIGSFPAYRFAGWATSEGLIQHERLVHDLGHPMYAMAQHELERAETLLG
ncbi:MAG: hypothetical protein ACO204_00675 [Schleiferiaceae bacterium]